jgi:hypothetical protein
MAYDSANVPEMFKNVPWRSCSVNLNFGDCSEDVTIYLAEQGVKNIVYSPDRKDRKEMVAYIARRGGADSMTLPTILRIKPSWKNSNLFDAVLYYCKLMSKRYSYVYIGTPDNDPLVDKRVKIISRRFRVIEVSKGVITAVSD